MNAKIARTLEAEKKRIGALIDAIETSADSTRFTEAEQADPLDVAAVATRRELEVTVCERYRRELLEIEAAISRLKAGTYGTCEHCHRPIGAERLEARPGARYCIEDQTRHERLEKRDTSPGLTALRLARPAPLRRVAGVSFG